MPRYIDHSLIQLLNEKVEGFQYLTAKQQRYTVSLIQINATSSRFEHSDDPTCFFTSYKYLEKVYGKTNFIKCMESLTPQLIYIEHAYSKGDGTTYAYKLTNDAIKLLEGYIQKNNSEYTVLIDASTGSKLRKGRRYAICSKTHKGCDVKSKLKFPARQSVNLPEMIKYHNKLKWHSMLARNNSQINMLREEYGLEFEKKIESLTFQIGQLIKFAKSPTGKGELYLRYNEATSGRLYGEGLHLQNVRKSVRNAALHGLYDYDIENCHFAFINQLAEQQGCECKGIRHYLANKKMYRIGIAKDLKISVEQVKTCLIAMVYGARNSVYEKAAIPNEIGEEKALLLYKHPYYKSLKDDLKRARRLIIGAAKYHAGWYTNVMGTGIKKSEGTEKVLAHLLQGLEAKVLNVVGELHADNIALLQHDGWVTRNPIDSEITKIKIYQETGIKVDISEERIGFTQDMIDRQAA